MTIRKISNGLGCIYWIPEKQHQHKGESHVAHGSETALTSPNLRNNSNSHKDLWQKEMKCIEVRNHATKIVSVPKTLLPPKFLWGSNAIHRWYSWISTTKLTTTFLCGREETEPRRNDRVFHFQPFLPECIGWASLPRYSYRLSPNCMIQPSS